MPVPMKIILDLYEVETSHQPRTKESLTCRKFIQPTSQGIDFQIVLDLWKVETSYQSMVKCFKIVLD